MFGVSIFHSHTYYQQQHCIEKTNVNTQLVCTVLYAATKLSVPNSVKIGLHNISILHAGNMHKEKIVYKGNNLKSFSVQEPLSQGKVYFDYFKLI